MFPIDILLRSNSSSLFLVTNVDQNSLDSNIESQKIKTDEQQLLQKCIEDVQIQLSQTNVKYNEQIQNGKLSEEENKNIKLLIASLEQKLKVLTFIYDNGIQNLKSHKTGLFYVK